MWYTNINNSANNGCFSGGEDFIMETRAITITSKQDKELKIKIIPGHFATNHSHINYYIDMTGIKTKHRQAKAAGQLLAKEYATSTDIDTIVCMDGTEAVAAYLADSLAESSCGQLNRDKVIRIITPEFNTNGQMLFRDNMQKAIWQQNILLLMASVSTGKSIIRSLECIKYYGGKVAGISALFSAIPGQYDVPVKALFTPEDLPDYHTYKYDECPFCKNGQKIDAIVNSFGYSKI